MKAKVLIPTGALGITYCKKTLNKGLKEKPDIIVVDGGSTDSGPAYLGIGKSKYSRSTTKSEWKTLMIARETNSDDKNPQTRSSGKRSRTRRKL